MALMKHVTANDRSLGVMKVGTLCLHAPEVQVSVSLGTGTWRELNTPPPSSKTNHCRNSFLGTDNHPQGAGHHKLPQTLPVGSRAALGVDGCLKTIQ